MEQTIVTSKANEKAFLDLIAWSEGTSTSRYTSENGYDIIVDGIDSPKKFSSFRDHPGILVTVNSKGLKSTAAGRYQLLLRWWKPYRDLLKLKDFSPASQDAVAIQQIRGRGALADVREGRISKAISKCSNIWASFPGNDYGQPTHKISRLISEFTRLGGTLHESERQT